MRTTYGPENAQIVFFEELKATLMKSLLLGLDVILLSVLNETCSVTRGMVESLWISVSSSH